MTTPALRRRSLLRAGAWLALSPSVVIAPSVVLAPSVALAAGPAAPERTRLAIGVHHLADMAHLPLVVADRLGYFRAAGLEISWVEGEGPVDVSAGPYEQLLQLPGRGPQHQAFVSLGRAPGLALGFATRAMPQARQVSDLRGRRVGVAASGNTAHLRLQSVSLRAGLAPSDWQVGALGGSAGALQALRAGQVDALCWGEPLMTVLEHRGELRIAGEARTLKGTEAVFGGPMPGACLHAPQVFVLRYPGTCQALATGAVRALRWLQTAGPRDILRTVPEAYLMGDLGLYLAAFDRVRDSYSTDGLITFEAGRTALRALAALEPGMRAERIDLPRSYTNAFARLAGERGRA